MVIIEAATEDDVPQIMEIELEAISPPWTHGALLSEIYNLDSLFAVARYADDTGNRRQGAEIRARENSSVLGFLILRRMADEGELLQIAIDKAARREGVADSLMEEALRYAEDNALVSVFLEVRKSNAAAIALYGKHGFEPVRFRKDYYSSPVEDAVLMVRK